MIKVENLTVKRKNKIIINNFSSTFNYGELVIIYGKSGSGKTTLLNCIGILENDYEGKISIDGNENCRFDTIKGRNLLRKKISFIFQNYGLIDNKTVLENLELGLYFSKKKSKEKVNIIKENLKIIKLQEKLNSKVYELSGGEQQRIALLRVMLKDSDIILADEPTGSLDEYNKAIVIEQLINLKNKNKMVIVVTHDKDFLEVADKCIKI